MKSTLILLFNLFLLNNLCSQQVIELCEETQSAYRYWANANTPGIFYWTVNGGQEFIGESFYVDWNTIGIGKHTIRLLFDNTKCTDEETYYVSVTECPVSTMYAPSAFTPNEDNLNEFWRPKGENNKYFSFFIYNRWGEQIYKSGEWTPETEMNYLGWNGTYKGRVVQDGVYTYFLEWRDHRSRYHAVYGKIVVLR